MKKLGLMDVLEGIEDTRRQMSVMYPLHEALIIMLLAVVCGAASYAKVEMFGKSNLNTESPMHAHSAMLSKK